MIVYLPRTQAFAKWDTNMGTSYALNQLAIDVAAFGEELSTAYKMSMYAGKPLPTGFIACHLRPVRKLVFHSWETGHPALGEFQASGQFSPYPF